MFREAAAALTILCGACGPTSDAHLLVVRAVEPIPWAPGATVDVHGEGFPAGRKGRAVCVGTLHRPGSDAMDVELVTDARAVSSETAKVEISDELVAAAHGRGTFRGRLQLLFDAAESGAVVSGESAPIVADVIDRTPGRHLEVALTRTQAANALLDRVGMQIDQTPVPHGLVVRHVAEGGIAHRAGLRVGHLIVEASGVRLIEPSDLAPSPDSLQVELRAQRSDRGSERLTLRSSSASTGDARFNAATLAFLFLAFLLLWLAPTAKLAQLPFTVTSNRDSLRASLGWLVGHPQDAPGGGRFSRLGWHSLAALAVTLAFGAFPFAARMMPTDVDLSALAALAIGIRAVSTMASKSGRTLAETVVLGRDTGVALLAVASVAVVTGTVGMEGVVASQTGAPWGWNVAQSPAGALGFAGLAAVATRTQGGPSRMSERLELFLWSGIAATVFLGGWNLPWIESDPLTGGSIARIAGLTVFCAKAWLFASISVALALGGQPSGWLPGLAAVGAISFSVGHVAGAWPHDHERLLGVLVAGGAAFVSVVVAIRSLRGRAETQPVFPTLE